MSNVLYKMEKDRINSKKVLNILTKYDTLKDIKTGMPRTKFETIIEELVCPKYILA